MPRNPEEQSEADELVALEDRGTVAQDGEDDGFEDDADLVEVAFKANRRAVYRNLQGLDLLSGMYVIVEADKGEDLGRVSNFGASLVVRRQRGERKAVLRLASDRELGRWRQLRPREDSALEDFVRRVATREMPMKPVDVEYQLDGRKVLFYFTAEHRVDFRELVRELASVYRTRIELRQIGVRDEAKRLGGIGPCGREMCCCSFLTDFAPITSQMARDQNLSLNPSKLSGMCGRLKCCLRFEHDFYMEARQRFPRLGARLTMDGVEQRVSKLDFFSETVTVRNDGGDELTVPLGELAKAGDQKPGDQKSGRKRRRKKTNDLKMHEG